MKDGEGERHLKLKDYKLKEAEMRLDYLEKERQRLEEENTKKEREAAVSTHTLPCVKGKQSFSWNISSLDSYWLWKQNII